MKLNYRFLTVIGVITLLGCASDKICFQHDICDRKWHVTFDVQNSPMDSTMRLQIHNGSGKRIILKNSLLVFFYGFNENLKQPYHDSINNARNDIVLYVPQSHPIEVTRLSLAAPISINSDSSFSFTLNKRLLASVAKKAGNPDNAFQLRNGFQLFVASTLPKNHKIQLASKIFVVNKD